MSARPIQPIPPDFINDGTIISLWQLSLDTHEIAQRLHLRESQIANRLAQLRDAGAL